MPEPRPAAGEPPRLAVAARGLGVAAGGLARLAVTVRVPASAEQTFAAATDWVGQARWIPFTTVTVVEGDGRGVGSVVHAFTGWRRLGFLDVMRITSWDPPRRVDVLHIGRLLRGPGSFTFVERGPDHRGPASTEFGWVEELALPLGRLGKAAWPVVRPLAAFALRSALGRFARHVGASVSPTP